MKSLLKILLYFLFSLALFALILKVEQNYYKNKFEKVSIGTNFNDLKKKWGDSDYDYINKETITIVYRNGVFFNYDYGFIFSLKQSDTILIKKQKYATF